MYVFFKSSNSYFYYLAFSSSFKFLSFGSIITNLKPSNNFNAAIGNINIFTYGYLTSNKLSKQNAGVPNSIYLFYFTKNVSVKF